MAISGVTDVLVIGDSPGPRKLVEALEKEIKVVNINILNHMIQGELTLNKVRTLKAPGEDASVHSTDHQVQRQSQTPMPTKQAMHGTAGPKGDSEVDHRDE
jgi:hypothetical protein